MLCNNKKNYLMINFNGEIIPCEFKILNIKKCLDCKKEKINHLDICISNSCYSNCRTCYNSQINTKEKINKKSIKISLIKILKNFNLKKITINSHFDTKDYDFIIELVKLINKKIIIEIHLTCFNDFKKLEKINNLENIEFHFSFITNEEINKILKIERNKNYINNFNFNKIKKINNEIIFGYNKKILNEIIYKYEKNFEFDELNIVIDGNLIENNELEKIKDFFANQKIINKKLKKSIDNFILNSKIRRNFSYFKAISQNFKIEDIRKELNDNFFN